MKVRAPVSRNSPTHHNSVLKLNVTTLKCLNPQGSKITITFLLPHRPTFLHFPHDLIRCFSIPFNEYFCYIIVENILVQTCIEKADELR